MKLGIIIHKNILILRVHAGEAKSDETGNSYKLSTSIHGDPIIESCKTGKLFALSWRDIITLAIEAGIDRPDPKKKK